MAANCSCGADVFAAPGLLAVPVGVERGLEGVERAAGKAPGEEGGLEGMEGAAGKAPGEEGGLGTVGEALPAG